VAALARYLGTPAADRDTDALLEPLRDLSVEIEGDDAEGSDKDKETARVLAGITFANAGETEEALETLGAGTQTENLEACVLHFTTASHHRFYVDFFILASV
jgi:coatomer subunit epsilon